MKLKVFKLFFSLVFIYNNAISQKRVFGLIKVEDINFSKPKLRLDPDMMKGIAEKIISGF